MAGQKRTKTKYKSIYFNEDTKKYDVKYNYKEYDPLKQKNIYKAKWIYNLRTLTEARAELAKFQTGENKTGEDKDLTLEGIYEVWKMEAKASGYSPVTERNTEQQIRMIYQFIPKETKLKNITADVYTELIAKCRQKGYAEETLHNINACFRKLMKLAWKKDYIKDNPLLKVENKRFKVSVVLDEDSEKYITIKEFEKIDGYFKNNTFVRLGFDRYLTFRLMVNFLYYTGLRIGELLALEFKDVKAVSYKRGQKADVLDMLFNGEKEDTESFNGFQVSVNKVFLDNGALERYPNRIRHETKNKKNRIIPLADPLVELFCDYEVYCYERGVKSTDRIFDFTSGNARQMITEACEKAGTRHHTPHHFRHTFISNLLDRGLSIAQVELFSGDTQETILKRYSHPNEQSKKDLVNALNDL